MDGVIVDTEPLHRKAYFEMFSHYDLDVSEDLYNSYTGMATLKVCQDLTSRFGLTCEPQILIDKKRAFFKEFFQHDPDFDLIPGVRELFENYHQNGIKMVLATSASWHTINSVFNRFELDQYFMDKISGADLTASKPNPEIFELAAKKSGESKENCIVIEDSTNGIKAASAAGIYCVAYKSKHSKNQEYDLAQKVISDFRDIYV